MGLYISIIPLHLLTRYLCVAFTKLERDHTLRYDFENHDISSNCHKSVEYEVITFLKINVDVYFVNV